MHWFEVALNNPLENWPVWLVLIVILFKTIQTGKDFFQSILADNAKSQQGNQQIIMQDNSIHAKLLDEMTARRTSDEAIKNRIVDLLDDKVTRIDRHTSETHGDVGTLVIKLDELLRRVKTIEDALRFFYRQFNKFKKEGITQ